MTLIPSSFNGNVVTREQHLYPGGSDQGVYEMKWKLGNETQESIVVSFHSLSLFSSLFSRVSEWNEQQRELDLLFFTFCCCHSFNAECTLFFSCHHCYWRDSPVLDIVVSSNPLLSTVTEQEKFYLEFESGSEESISLFFFFLSLQVSLFILCNLFGDNREIPMRIWFTHFTLFLSL